jgi:uncharacterized RmlC-like cupin family protein
VAKIIKREGLTPDMRYGPNNLRAAYGIDRTTVENPKMTMQYSVVPPKARNQRHYHVTCDAGMYILKGRLRLFFGPDPLQEEAVVEPGDFVFIPQGEIHGLENLSDTEPAELIATYGGAGSKEEAQVIFMEPRWN